MWAVIWLTFMLTEGEKRIRRDAVPLKPLFEKFSTWVTTPLSETLMFAPAPRVAWVGVMVTVVFPLVWDWDMVKCPEGERTSPEALAETRLGRPTWRVGICSLAVPLLTNVKLSLMTAYPSAFRV